MKDPIITYKLIDEAEWRTLIIDKSKFYDDGETEFSIFDSVDRHFLEPRNYIKSEADHNRIVFLNFFLENDAGDKVMKRITYWNNGLNQVQEYQEIVNNEIRHRTIISSVYIDDKLQDCLVMRFDQHNDNLIPITQTILRGDEIMSSFKIPKY